VKIFSSLVERPLPIKEALFFFYFSLGCCRQAQGCGKVMMLWIQGLISALEIFGNLSWNGVLMGLVFHWC